MEGLADGGWRYGIADSMIIVGELLRRDGVVADHLGQQFLSFICEFVIDNDIADRRIRARGC